MMDRTQTPFRAIAVVAVVLTIIYLGSDFLFSARPIVSVISAEITRSTLEHLITVVPEPPDRQPDTLWTDINGYEAVALKQFSVRSDQKEVLDFFEQEAPDQGWHFLSETEKRDFRDMQIESCLSTTTLFFHRDGFSMEISVTVSGETPRISSADELVNVRVRIDKRK